MKDEQHSDLERSFGEMANQFFDVAMNPIAGMFCTLLAVQVQKGLLSKSEAKGIVASSVDLLNQLPYSNEIIEGGAKTMLRMIRAIDAIPEQPTV